MSASSGVWAFLLFRVTSFHAQRSSVRRTVFSFRVLSLIIACGELIRRDGERGLAGMVADSWFLVLKEPPARRRPAPATVDLLALPALQTLGVLGSDLDVGALGRAILIAAIVLLVIAFQL